MPSAAPALSFEPATSISSAMTTNSVTANTATWTAWNRLHVVGTGAGGGGTIIVSNDSPTTATWTSWNEDYTATTAAITAPTLTLTGSGGTVSNARIWVAWNEGGHGGTAAVTQSITSSSADTWVTWNQAHLANTVVRKVQMSDEEYQAALRQQEEASRLRQERYRVEQVEREAANARAAIILEENLTAEQRAELAAKQYFTLKSLRPNGEERIYRIHRGRSHNIERVDAAGNRMQRYCMHPIVNCPVEDTMLTQKFWLQTPELEDELLRRANRS